MVAQITQLPTPPSRQRPSTFSDEADAFLGALPAFGTEANTLASDVNNISVQVTNSATTATNAAITATTAASTATSAKDTAVQKAQEVEAIDDYWQPLQLGPKATFPTLDNQGNPLIIGAEFYNTTTKARYSWNGTAWAIGTNVTAGVESVNGKTGVVNLVATDIAPAATVSEMMIGTEQEYRSMSPSLVQAAVGGVNNVGTIYTGTQKPTVGTWLECGKVYLQSSYTELFSELGLLHDYGEVVAANIGISFTSAATVISAMAFGADKFVAVAKSGSTPVSTSVDGRVWQARTMPVAAAWSAVTYGAGRFVAVSNGSASATSTDGINWTAGTLPISASWAAITYGAGLFVAFADSGNVAATSPDGITWTARTLPASATWSAVAFGNGVFAAVAKSSATFATSPDGITWTARTVPANMQAAWNSMAFGAGVFVVVRDYTSTNASIQSAWSADGITWTTTQLASTDGQNWRAIVWAVDKFIVFGITSGGGTSGYVATSATGKAWTATTISSSYYLANEGPVCSAAGNGYVSMFASSATASRACTSRNGTTWESGLGFFAGTINWGTIEFLEGRFFVLPSSQASAFLTSTDGVNWTPRFFPLISANSSITYGNGQYVALISDGRTAVSTDGLNWALGPTIAGFASVAVTYGAGKFVAVQSGSTSSIAYSTDLVTWTVVNVGSSLGFNDIAFGAGRFMISCNNNNYWTSTDGIAWTSARSPLGGMTSIGFMGGRFVAMSGSSTRAAVATSLDGIVWETAVMPLSTTWGAVSYGEGLFFTASTTEGGVIAVSTDCKKWTMKTPDSFSGATKSAYGAGQFVGMPTGAGNYLTLPYASYSRSTQFYVPRAFPEVEGVKQWMRAV